MKDIAPELLEKLQKEFKERFENNDKLNKLYKLLTDGKAMHKDSNDFAILVGEILSQVFKENLSSADLPDGKMYYNIADRILNPTLKENHKIISNFAKEVQTDLNHRAGLRIKGKAAKLNQDRIDGIINRISYEDDFDKAKWLLDEPVVNFSQSIVDDTIKENAEFHHKLGLGPKIIRKESGNCCDWCNAVVGTYKYPDVPKDIYKRHRYCRCTVEYDPGDGRRQNVHSKKWKRDGESLEKFRERQTNDIIRSRKEKDREEIKKAQRKLHNSLVGKEINGVKINEISIHVAERTTERRVTVKDIVDAVKNPLKIGKIKYDKENRPSFMVVGQKATVYVNPTNQTVTTTHKTSSKKAKKLLEDKYENRNK